MTADELKAYRVALGVSQDTLAQRIGVTPNGYRAWERGRRPVPQPVVNLLTAWRQLGPGSASSRPTAPQH